MRNGRSLSLSLSLSLSGHSAHREREACPIQPGAQGPTEVAPDGVPRGWGSKAGKRGPSSVELAENIHECVCDPHDKRDGD